MLHGLFFLSLNAKPQLISHHSNFLINNIYSSFRNHLNSGDFLPATDTGPSCLRRLSSLVPTDMEESQDVGVTSSSLVDAPVPGEGKAGEFLVADTQEWHGDNLSDDGVWLTDCDEEADEAFYLNREGKRRREEFYNAGYRDGLIAGKDAAAQDGFNLGFKDSVMVGYKWGTIRGVTSALAHIPNELKLKLVETEAKRKEFLNLYEAVESIGTEDALKLFHDDIQRGALPGKKKSVESSSSSISHTSDSEHSELESYFEKLDLLLKEIPVVDVQLELNHTREP